MVRGLVGRWVIVKEAYNARLQTRSGASSYSGRVCMHCMACAACPGHLDNHRAALQVRSWITKMKREGKAFFTSRTYLLAGVLLEKPTSGPEKSGDLTEELLSIMTSLH